LKNLYYDDVINAMMNVSALIKKYVRKRKKILKIYAMSMNIS
jgi:hypothetical protein